MYYYGRSREGKLRQMSLPKRIGSPGRNPMAHSNQVILGDLNKGTIYKRCRQSLGKATMVDAGLTPLYMQGFSCIRFSPPNHPKDRFYYFMLCREESEVQGGRGSYPSMLAGEQRHSHGSVRLTTGAVPTCFFRGTSFFPSSFSVWWGWKHCSPEAHALSQMCYSEQSVDRRR